MYITLIIFLIGYLLHRNNIISQTSKFLLLVSYKNVDPIGHAFKAIIEGFLNLIVTFPLSRFMVSEFFGRDDSVSSFTGRLIVKYNTIKSLII